MIAFPLSNGAVQSRIALAFPPNILSPLKSDVATPLQDSSSKTVLLPEQSAPVPTIFPKAPELNKSIRISES